MTELGSRGEFPLLESQLLCITASSGVAIDEATHTDYAETIEIAPPRLQAEPIAFQPLCQWCGKSLRPTSSFEILGLEG
jgi:hypothetical protein